MQIELITTGTELLIDRVNTHAVYLGQELQQLGTRLARQTSVGDGDEIAPVLEEALSRSDIILVTGGLGPTSDDLTRDIAARLLERELVYQSEIEAHIRYYFDRISKVPPESVFRQALVPEGAEVLHNAHGTAPGLMLETNAKQIFLLPGPPRELKPMWTKTVMPKLKNRLGDCARTASYKCLVGGIGESAVQERVEQPLQQQVPGIDIAYCASPGKVELRLNHTDAAALDQAVIWVKAELKRAIHAENGIRQEQAVVEMAMEKQLKLATAESCTGGLVAHRLTNVSGASAVLERGFVTYSNEAKQEQIGVPAELIASEGAVSPEVAAAMACGALKHSQADLAVSLTGIAGPTGGTDEKPVGLVYLGIAYRPAGEKNRIIFRSIKKHLVPERETFKNMASDVALDLLRRRLLNWK
ncbi:MAG: competence/damage-inducible protein A [Verrucomicrobiota bacterium]